MKKFLILAVVSLLILSVFAACGGKGEEIKNDMTTAMDDMTSVMDALTSEGRGEVTEDETTEEDLTDETTLEVETTDILEKDTTEAESTAKSILDDIPE